MRMHLIKVLDSDDVNRPVAGDRRVFAGTEAGQPLTKEQLVKNFPSVFADVIGKLDGKHHIRLDPSVNNVQHVPRRVQVALRSKLQSTLEDLVQQDVLAPVTPWMSSVVVVPKRNGN